ncbi:MAG: TM2 domain-containing protein [Fibromonadaceae bacterium]|jgi:TM2 domain-containing membrane protein YozV|nr:TM2 domain-containing protein [Fibromonadaceae bacterium]
MEENQQTSANVSDREWNTTLLLAIFLGGFGADRFYVGKMGSGIAKLLTGGGCGIWAIIDMIALIQGNYTDAEGKLVRKVKESNSEAEVSEKEWNTTFLLELFLGTLGVDRFYVGKTGSGIAKLLTAGGCLIWSLIDMIALINGTYTDAEGKVVRKKF